MKKYKYKAGVTLVEMLVAVSIIAILATMVIAIAARVDNQGKEQLTNGTFKIIDAALEQFKDFGYQLKNNSTYTSTQADFYYGLKFPVDCNGYKTTELVDELQRTEALSAGSVSINPAVAHNDVNYSGIEVAYFYLSRVPECKKTLERIDRSLITNDGANAAPMMLIVDGKNYPLYRIVDPWKTPLRYDYYDRTETNYTTRTKGRKNFPVLISAGPDKVFGTVDDLKSR